MWFAGPKMYPLCSSSFRHAHWPPKRMINNLPHLRLPLISASFSPFLQSLAYGTLQCLSTLVSLGFLWRWGFLPTRGFRALRTGLQLSLPLLGTSEQFYSQEAVFSAPNNGLSKSLLPPGGLVVLTLPLVLPPRFLVHTQPLPEADVGEVPEQQPSKQRRAVEKQWSHQNLGQVHAPGNTCGHGEMPFYT